MFDFREFRKENNFTQKQAAEYFGCEQSFISLIETGRSKIPQEFISKILADPALKFWQASTKIKENLSKKINAASEYGEHIGKADLIKIMNNISEAARLNAEANDRNSKNMEKMLNILEAKK